MRIRRFIKSFRYGQKGFTLIELLVVVAILGILAAIVVPNFATFFGRGQTEACQIELRMVQTATMTYVADKGVCPAIGDLAPYFGAGSTLIGTYTITNSYPDCPVVVVSCP